MSYSDFKEQKCSNLRADGFSGFSVEAADNLSNTLIESTAFFKKSFWRTFAWFDDNRSAVRLFQARRAIVSIRMERATRNFNFFSMYQRSMFRPLSKGSPSGLRRMFQQPAFVWTRRAIVVIKVFRSTRKSNYFYLRKKEQILCRSSCDALSAGSPQMRLISREQGDG